jgi:5-methylcytosine-specific restriction endonuclease McrA
MTMEIISREDAQAAGLKRYFTDKPCRHGHIAERKVCNKVCCECARLDGLTHTTIAASRAAAHRAKEEAKAAGLKSFFTGKPCKRGHVAERDIRTRQCCECKASDNRRYAAAHRAKHPGENAAYLRKYYAANSEKARESAKQYRKENAEIVRAKAREAWRTKPERRKANKLSACKRYAEDAGIRERKRLYEQANYCQERAKVKNNNRRAMIHDAGGKISKTTLARLRKKQHDLCVFCEADISIRSDLDHILALSRGGINEESNLQLLCPSCNSSKSAKTMEEYADHCLLKLKVKLKQLRAAS